MDLAGFIEHTDLRPTVTGRDIDERVKETILHGFTGVCIPPFWVKRARRELGASTARLVTVAGFPLGYAMTETKLEEIRRAIDDGADEIDLVWNLSAFKTGMPWTKIELARCSRLAHDHQRILKVIIETAYLSDDEVRRACTLCADAGADFVKTSSGFSPEGARADTVRTMRSALPSSVGIKASGGIKTAAQAIELIEAGASRIGTSSGVNIIMNNPAHT